jgi:hypothetical protein
MDLIEAFDMDLLDGIEAWIPPLDLVRETQRLLAHDFGVAEKIIDYVRNHGGTLDTLRPGWTSVAGRLASAIRLRQDTSIDET